ncbi:MAG TPA: hypothetical protein VF618_20610 [Thermoanaerobaculia bacterium]
MTGDDGWLRISVSPAMLALVLALASLVPPPLRIDVTPERAVSAPVVQPVATAGNVDLASNGELLLVVWADKRSALSYDIVAARIDRNGRNLDPEGIVISRGVDWDESPVVAWNGRRFVILWNERTVVNPGPLSGKARVAEVDVDGNVHPRGGAALPNLVAADVASNGSTTVALVNYPSGVAYTASTLARIDGTQLTNTTGLGNNLISPRLVRLGAGYAVTWLELDAAETTWSVRALRVDANGNATGAARTLAAFPTGDNISYAAGGNGEQVIVAAAVRDDAKLFRIDSSFDVTALEGLPANHYVGDVTVRDDGFDIQGFDLTAFHPVLFRFDRTTLVQTLSFDQRDAYTRLATLGGRTYRVLHRAGTIEGAFLGSETDEVTSVANSIVEQEVPAVASDGESLLVFWRERNAGVARRFTVTGSPLGEPVTLSPRMVSGSVVADNRGYLVAWQEMREPSEELYQYLLVRRFGTNDALLLSSTANIDARPRMASDGTNTLIVWVEGYYAAPRLRAALLTPGGLAPAFDLPANTLPDVVWNGETYLITAMTRDDMLRAITVSRQGTVVATHDLSTGFHLPSSVAWNGSEHLVVYGGEALRTRRLRQDGTPLGPETVLASMATPLESFDPQVEWNGAAFVIVWAKHRWPGGPAELFARIGDEAFSVMTRPGPHAAPHMVSLGSGVTALVYQSVVEETNVSRVFLRNIEMSGVFRKRRAVR